MGVCTEKGKRGFVKAWLQFLKAGLKSQLSRIVTLTLRFPETVKLFFLFIFGKNFGDEKTVFLAILSGMLSFLHAQAASKFVYAESAGGCVHRLRGTGFVF